MHAGSLCRKVYRAFCFAFINLKVPDGSSDFYSVFAAILFLPAFINLPCQTSEVLDRILSVSVVFQRSELSSFDKPMAICQKAFWCVFISNMNTDLISINQADFDRTH